MLVSETVTQHLQTLLNPLLSMNAFITSSHLSDAFRENKNIKTGWPIRITYFL